MLFGTQRINSDGHLEIGGCDAIDLAREYGTPVYIMDEQQIRDNCRSYINGFTSRYEKTKIAFAGKAFLNIAMCKLLDQEGMSLDVASAGEIYTAIKADFPMERIFFHGNAKPRYELEMAIDYGIGRIVVDNLYELETLNDVAMKKGKKAKILLRLTPGIDPHTHRLISTGQADTKFGMNIEDGTAMCAVKKALESPGVVLKGIHCHVGSQLLDLDAHIAGVRIMVEFAKQVHDKTGYVLEEINTGGGLGIPYKEDHLPPTIDQFAEAITNVFKDSLKKLRIPNAPTLIQEPGRSIVGTAGTTLYTVGVVKKVPITEDPGYRIYVAVDGGMSDNPRPLLYDAEYDAIVANKANMPRTNIYTIAGRHCETDTLIQDISLPNVQIGDTIAVLCTGAYNYSMASNYNRFTRPPVVLVSNHESDLMVERETLDDLIKHDVVPLRLQQSPQRELTE